jgi:hypothetical protein
MILSFAWTTAAVCCKAKTETRRDWTASQIELAIKQMREERPVDAWTKSPRFKGEQFGQVLITGITEHEDAATIPDEAWAAEGFEVLTAINASFAKGCEAPDVWRFWRQSEPGANIQTVVRFKVLRLNDVGLRIQAETMDRLNEARPVTLQDLRAMVTDKPEWRGV